MGDSQSAVGDAPATRVGLIAIIAILAVATFLIDLSLPRGLAGGLLYLGVVLSGWWLARPGQVLWLAGLSSVLLAFGHLAAQGPILARLTDFGELAGLAGPEAGNRLLALVALWAVAGVLAAAKRREMALRRSRRALAARLQERGARLAATRTEAEMARRSASELLNGIGHELRTPLNAVLGFSEILLKELFGPIGNPRYRGYVADIHNSGRHLLELIEGLMAMARVESGRIELREETIEVGPFLNACLENVAERARAGEVATETEVPEALSPLLADRRKLRQAVTNLLSNAVKFTPPGGRVVLRAWSEPGSGYVFQVEDSGVGMALKDVPQALAPFGQLDNPLRRRLDGTGLGLPLAKALIELHAGSLHLQSEAGVGTIVTLRLPAERLAAMPKVA